MKFKVMICIKQVPSSTEIKIDPATNTLIREGAENIINPFDVYAIEEGVRIKERLAGTTDIEIETVVVTMGPPQSEKILREAISLGADKAVLLSDRAFAGSDTLATSRVLSAAAKKLGDVKIILCGKQTMDGDTGQVGPEIGQLLNMPFVGYISEIQLIALDRILLKQLKEKKYDIIETELPAVLSVLKEINSPRIPGLKNMMKAKAAPIEKWGINDLQINPAQAGLDGSATRVIKIFKHEIKNDTKVIENNLKAQVDEICKELFSYGKT
ncbi:MAG: electron transfer flavoprotein subunit beta/FixA family protein [Actinomycetota bacterium]|nr:electron transfer flavoprotein subunit beta/FixA family protein [Actinomycetota bacterium]